MSHYIMKTTEQWDAVSMNNYIIPRGTICVEIVSKELMKLKIGDGTRVYHKLPYLPRINEIDLSAYYTKTEIDALIQNIGSELSQYYTKTEIDQIIQNINVDLSDYAKISYVDAHTHTHDNQSVLDQITAPFTVDDKTKLDSIHVKDYDTQIQELQSKSHSHENQDVLDQITQTHVDEWHTHSNQLILDNITASFTVDDKTKLDSLSVYDVFEGASAYEGGNIGLVPAPEEGDQDKFLRGDGTWGTVSSLGGYATEQYVDDAIAAIPEYTLPTASDETLGGVIIGDNINVDNSGVISVDLPKPSSFYTPGDGISIGNMTLSEDFEYLSFIQFNGGTVFDTGEIHKAHDKFEIDFECTNINGDTLFDSRSYNIDTNTYGVHILDNGVVYLNRSSPSYAPVYDNSFKLELNGQYKLITQDMTMSIYDYETNELLEETSTAPSDMFLDDGLYTMTLGNIHNRDHYHHSSSFGYYKLFRFKWYRDNELIHDFIPARRNTDNVVGLYDSVTGTMITPGYQNSAVPMTYGTIIDPDSLIDFSINVTPATTTEIGGIIVGRGLTIDEDGVLDVEFPEYNNTTYEAGSGISIQEADHLASLGYRRLDYIDSNGQQYIDTGFVPSNNTTIVIDSIPHTAGHSITNNVTLFGTMLNNAYNADEWMFWCYSGGSEEYQNQGCPGIYCRGQNNAITLTGVNFETRCTITASTSHRNITINYPDGTSITRSPANTNAFSTPVNTLYLFHSNTESAPAPLRKTYTRMYSCQIFDNDALLMDLIPVQRISDDKVGMYDIQNDQFYTSQTDVEFIAGTAHEGSVNNQISITPATTTAIGGVIIGEGINVTQDGTISVDQSIIPDVPEELGVMDLQVKQNEVGVLTSTKPNNVTEDLDVLQYLGVLTLNVGFTPGQEVPSG